MPHTAFVTCPRGLESLLLNEVNSLGVDSARETAAGVSVEAGLSTLYRICLWSRLANRVLLELERFEFDSESALYEGAQRVDWSDHLDPDKSLSVTCTGATGGINNSRFGALRIKDAIVDQLRERHGRRPDVDPKSADFSVHARLHRGRAILSIDLSGESLHRRGYRIDVGTAPIKENLACALLLRAGWPDIARQNGALIDPLCGAGTLLLEACQLGLDTAPGLARARWGFDGWLGHVPKSWQDLQAEALERQRQAMADSALVLIGYDGANSAVQNARRNIERAGLTQWVKVYQRPLAELKRPTHLPLEPGLVITNPPYGVRLRQNEDINATYVQLGRLLREEFGGWRAALITAAPELGKLLELRANKQYRFFNGALASRLLVFDVDTSQHRPITGSRQKRQPARPVELSEGARAFANRLRKNSKHLRRWAKRNDVDCYRLYDADMPEYAVTVDIYADFVHVAEYRAPPGVDESAAARRLEEVMNALPVALERPAEHIVLKQRQRQRGRTQYQQHASSGRALTIHEGAARLEVNLHDYLDTGLFLDHRKLRLAMVELAPRKHVLNLFCYTASLSVHAALAGAASTTSVDLSKTYLDWARRNFELNNISSEHNLLIRADCIAWLERCQRAFDLIILDAPTFSNSKNMTGTLDIARDHVELIDAAMRLLNINGLLLFSNNKRRFKLDPSIQRRYRVEDKTRWSLDEDFSRARPAHQLWFIDHRDD